MTPSRREFLKSAGVVGAAAVAAGPAPRRGAPGAGGRGAGRRPNGADLRPGGRLRGGRRQRRLPHHPAARPFRTTSARGTAWCPRWPRPATACWRRTCAATGRRGFSTPTRRAWPSRPPSPSTSSTSPTRWGSSRPALAGFDWGNRARLHHVDPPPGTRARTGRHRRLLGAGHRVAVAAVPLGPGRGAPLVPVVLQHGARAAPASRRTATPSSATCGRRGRRPGSTPTRRTSARRRRSTTPTSSTS